MREEIYFDIEATPHAKEWNALSADQLLACMRIISSGRDQLRKVELLSAVLCYIQPHQALFISIEDADSICSFLLEQESKLTINRFPSIRSGILKKLYGPSDAMGNSSFGEFIMADSYCMNYIRSEKVEWLDKLIACLYRPRKRKYNPSDVNFDGDVREKFNNNNLPSRLKQISRLDSELKHAILAYFIGCKNQFASTYRHLFTRGEGGNGSSPWLDTLSSYSKGVQHFDDVLDSNAGIVLFDLDKNVKDSKELEKKLKST